VVLAVVEDHLLPSSEDVVDVAVVEELSVVAVRSVELVSNAAVVVTTEGSLVRLTVVEVVEASSPVAENVDVPVVVDSVDVPDVPDVVAVVGVSVTTTISGISFPTIVVLIVSPS
jgi:allophanate hydrolase subunit 1